MNKHIRTLARGRLAARASVAVLAVAMAAGTTAGVASAQQQPGVPLAEGVPVADVGEGFTGKLATRLDKSRGPVSVFIETTDTPAVDVFSAATAAGRSNQAAAGEANTASATAEQTSAEVVQELESAGAAPQEIFRTSNAVTGVAVTADAEQVRALVDRDDVKKVYPLTPKTVTNGSADVLTNTLQTWQDAGLFGDGVRIGIIDTGIDYTHADFGGPGTVAAYEAEDAIAEDDSLDGDAFPTAKVTGGFDFVGDDYNASGTTAAELTPDPDPTPLDCQGHGSHVAGTAGGAGVNPDGSTFDGDYAALTADEVQNMRIGPGTAPNAELFALRVFGCEGSTNVTAQALDYSLDPDGDGDFSDRLDVINLSLGSEYGAPDDPENVFVQKLADNGVLSVFSQGNGGDLYDVGGTPGNSPAALTVASSRDAAVLRDGAEVTAPADVAGIKGGQYSIAYDFTSTGDLAATEVAALTQEGNLDGCAPLSAADAALVEGKIAWLEWDDDGATRECGSVGRTNNATAAGAVGAIFTSELEQFSAGLSGNAEIPVFQFTGSDTAALRPALAAGTLQVAMRGELKLSIAERFPEIEDTLSDFSSRGVRGPAVKPEVSAPGDTIVSAEVGSGDGASQKSGTSMAAPHTAGIASLVRQLHPDWTVEEVKAAVVNTTGPDVSATNNGEGPFYGPQRAGTGRVDALAATSTQVLATVAEDPGYVSASFGVVEAGGPVELTKTIELINKGNSAVTFSPAYVPSTEQPGVSYSLSADEVSLTPRGVGSVTLTMSIEDPTELRKTLDPTMEATQSGLARQFVSDASGVVELTPTVAGPQGSLQVPVYTAAKPVSDLSGPDSLEVSGPTPSILTLTGRGLAQGEGSQAYTSLVTPMQLTGTSPELPACGADVQVDCVVNGTAAGADLRNVGASVAGEGENALLGFGINTWGSIYNLGSTNIPFVDIDVDGDGEFDFETYLFKPPGTDLLLAATIDLALPPEDENFQVDLQAVNGALGDVDTNLFDTTALVLPVSVAALGLDADADSAPITFAAGIFGAYPAPAAETSTIDSIGDMSFDVAAPALSVRGDGDPALTYVSADGTNLAVVRDPATSTGDEDLLLIHHQNAVGAAQGQVVDVTGGAPEPAPVTNTTGFFLAETAGGPTTLGASFGRVGDVGLTCDWDGDGVDTPGVFRDGQWFLRNTTSTGGADVSFTFGRSGDQPVCGDWDGDATDTIGVYRNGVVYLRDASSVGAADETYGYGRTGDTALAGDFDGDGADSVGVRRGSTFFLRNETSSGAGDAAVSFGKPSDTPLVGDWDGNATDTPAVRRASTWFLSNGFDGAESDRFSYGKPSDQPVAGAYGGAADGVGVVRY